MISRKKRLRYRPVLHTFRIERKRPTQAIPRAPKESQFVLGAFQLLVPGSIYHSVAALLVLFSVGAEIGLRFAECDAGAMDERRVGEKTISLIPGAEIGHEGTVKVHDVVQWPSPRGDDLDLCFFACAFRGRSAQRT